MRRTNVAEHFQVSAEINVTPMIDVMLVLLIIFMVVTPAIAGGVLLPRARTAAPEREDRVTLAIDREGRLYLDSGGNVEGLAPSRLGATLAAAYARRPGDHVLYLKADGGASYAHVLAALDAARQAGVSRVGMITELPRQEQRRSR